MDDYTFMEAALIEARYANEQGEVPVGAVIVVANKIVATGYNRREQLQDATAHAEIVAIRKACRELGRWRLTDATLYVTLEPCAMCAGAIVNARIKRLVYGASDSVAGAIHSWFGIPFAENLNHRPEVVAGIMEADCQKILLEFFGKVR
ncbi:MAG: tRNA adenosine(34) deaminase TadA [Negativicutes bacterium]